MARIRTIKPEILTDEKTSELTSQAWRLFVSMISLADDHGNLRAKPVLLSAQVFHSCPDRANTDKLLDELAASGLVLLYDVGDQRYANIVNFRKHQRIDNAGKPHVPGPNSELAEFRGESRRFAAGSKDLRIKGSKDLRTNKEEEPAGVSPVLIMNLWNQTFEGVLPAVMRMTDARKKKIKARCEIEQLSSEGGWRNLFKKARSSSMMCGDNDRNWTVSLDWLIKNDDNPTKTLEGKYDNKAATGTNRRKPEKPKLLPEDTLEDYEIKEDAWRKECQAMKSEGAR
jgi:hypothetical protein